MYALLDCILDGDGLVEFQRFDVGAWSHLCLDRIAYNTDGMLRGAADADGRFEVAIWE